jgi:hypothetical protein
MDFVANPSMALTVKGPHPPRGLISDFFSAGSSGLRTKHGTTLLAASARFMVRGYSMGVLIHSKQNAGCTKHIIRVGQAPVARILTATRVGHGVALVPRRALEIQPYRGAGQGLDSK